MLSENNLNIINNKRLNILYLSRTINNYVGKKFWNGFIDSAKEKNINLICFRGGQIGKDKNSIIYNYVNTKYIDGIISWASSEIDDNLRFYEKFKNFPIVTLTLQIKDIPCVAIDTYNAMMIAMEHLIKVHGYKKIAYIRSSDHHFYARERYNAYIDALKKYNLTVNKELITDPYDNPNSSEGLTYLLDQKKFKIKTDIEAIIAASNVITNGLIPDFNRRKIHIPNDLGLIAYNDSNEAKFSNPSLTHITMPFEEQAKKSIEILTDFINGNKVPEKTLINSKLALGYSCGCHSSIVDGAGKSIKYFINKKVSRFANNLNIENFKKNIAECIASLKNYINDKTHEEFLNNTVEKIFSLFLDQTITFNTDPNLFIIRINEILFEFIKLKINLDIFHDIISFVRTKLLENINDKNIMLIIENLSHQARVITSETIERNKENEQYELVKYENKLREIGVKLNNSFNFDDIIKILTNSFKAINIPGCNIFLYEKTKTDLENNMAPDRANLIFSYKNFESLNQQSFDKNHYCHDLIKHCLNNIEKNSIFVVESLFFDKIQLGYILFELGSENGDLYYNLRDQISSSIYGAMLMEENNSVKKMLGNTLNLLQKKLDSIYLNSENISKHVNNLTISTEQAALSLTEISKNINSVMDVINESVNLALNTNLKITDMTEQSDKIQNFTLLITDISEKTKLLSFNASIEAARSGVYGKGFSIIANEIKNLAKKTNDFTKEIYTIIKRIQSGSQDSALEITKVVNTVKKVLELSSSIKNAINEQADVSNEVSKYITNTSHEIKEITQAILELSEMSKKNSI
ncbi:MAG: substrate-binding domain-containing protein [Spirochaetes bacterium]|nr:substrate-binding domain-containing protein [Spirochaetota bacterium]